MRKPNIPKLSTAELEEYRILLERELTDGSRHSAKMNRLRSKMEALADAEGIGLSDLLDIKLGRPKGVKAEPKYQSPNNAELLR